MEYKDFQEEIIALEKAKIEYVRREKMMGNYMNLFQIVIDILGRLFYLGKQIKNLKKT